MESTIIRVHGSREYWDRVALVAQRKKTSLAAFVKNAMDEVHGQDIEDSAALFFPPTGAQMHQNEIEADHV